MGLQIKTLHVNGSSKVAATDETGEGARAPDGPLGAAEMDVVLEILLLRLCFFSISVSINKFFEDRITRCNSHVAVFHEAWDYRVSLVSLLRQLIGGDFQGSWK